MKIAALVFALLISRIHAECASSVEHPINDATKLSFSGFVPNVKRTLNTGVGNKIVLRGYQYEPIISEAGNGVLEISSGDPCDGTPPLIPNPNSPNNDESSAAATYLGWGLAGMFLNGRTALTGSTLALGMTVGLLSSAPTGALAQQNNVVSECDLAPIEVEIYVDTMASEIVQMEYQTGDYETCPPETTYWKHHPSVFDGYEGCVSERGFYPCATDAAGLDIDEGAFYAQSPVYWDGSACVETDYTMSNRSFWIVFGDPMDKHEINKRSGINPVVSFPFIRMPYSKYELGSDPSLAQDDSNDVRVKAKELLEYIGAWTVEELADWSITITEGAEQGMVHLFAAKAMEIAMTTCHRDIPVLMQVPAYGYSTTDAANIANRFSADFYNSSECDCFADDSCKDPILTITVQGWLPNTPFPEAVGGDGVTYAANSDSPTSPWFESLVFPENPSGVFKTGQIPDSNRRVCDGVYLWPMYMGGRNFTIPKSELPDCSAWSFSISKIYSAAARAGWILYKNEPVSNYEAIIDAIGTSLTLTHGSLSEWTWHGMLQLFDTFMSKPLDDPTSWIAAYTSIIKDKWDAIVDGFDGCPVVQVSNPYSGAYVWFVFQEPYLGIQNSSTPSFFRDVLGVEATTYNWGFRGATPSDFYGDGYDVNDFTRLQLYRDVEVYKEVGRRAKIVCNDLDAIVSDSLLSVNQWVAAETATRRRHRHRQLLQEKTEPTETVETRQRFLSKAVVPALAPKQVEFLARGQLAAEEQDAALQRRCAPEFTTECLFSVIGLRRSDDNLYRSI